MTAQERSGRWIGLGFAVTVAAVILAGDWVDTARQARVNSEITRLASRLWLAEMYPAEWSDGAVVRWSDGAVVLSLDGGTVRARLRTQQRLTPLIVNATVDRQVRDPEITLWLPGLTVRDARRWQPIGGDGWWASNFTAGVPALAMRGVNDSLFISAPMPGAYVARWEIRAAIGEYSLTRDGAFTIVFAE